MGVYKRLLGLSLATALLPAFAQTPMGRTAAPVDLTKSNPTFAPTQRPKGVTASAPKAPEIDQKINRSPYSGTKTWSGKQSNLLEKKSKYDTGNTKSFKDWNGNKTFGDGDKKFQTKRYADSGKLDPAYDKATQRDNFLAAKYRDAWTARLGPSGKEMMDFSKQLSMRDVNRFQFRSSHSETEGLPVQVAGAQSGGNRPLEYTLFSDYDSTPRSTGYIKQAPKGSSLADPSDDASRSLSLGARGFSRKGESASAASPAAPQGGEKAPPMMRRQDFEKLGKPVKTEWKATSRVLD